MEAVACSPMMRKSWDGCFPIDRKIAVKIKNISVPEDVDTTDATAGASIVVSDGEKLGNTEYVAELIQETVGGDLFRIETVEEYPLDHDPLVDQAADEQDENTRLELVTHVENFGQYEYVFLGFPNWWGDMPMAVYSFLEEYDFGAKTRKRLCSGHRDLGSMQ